MEKILNEFCIHKLIFSEKDELFDLSELIKKIIDKYNNDNISSNISSEIFIWKKKFNNEELNNLIDNSIKYGKRVNVELIKSSNNIFIKIDDDGPGIPERVQQCI